MKSANQITPAEFQIIEILWSSPRSLNVTQVQRRLAESRELAYTTVMTMLDKLARKESVERVKRGKAYFYRPRVSRQEVLDCLIDDFTRDYFQGNRGDLREFLSAEQAEGANGHVPASPELQVELL